MSLQWLRLLLWLGFDLWPGNFHMPWVQPKKIMVRVPAVVQQLKDPALSLWQRGLIPSLAQWIKDPALPWLWHRSQLWLGFDPCPRNSNVPHVNQKKKKKKKIIKSKLNRSTLQRITTPFAAGLDHSRLVPGTRLHPLGESSSALPQDRAWLPGCSFASQRAGPALGPIQLRRCRNG